MNRREFITAGAAAGLVGGVPAVAGAATPRSAGGFVEPSKTLDVDDWADVIVVGGGPAGIAAAVTAARRARKVRLFEMHGCLGGVWTSGLLTYIFDFDKSETGWEIIRRLDAYRARVVDRPAKEHAGSYPNGLNRDWVYEPEYMKAVCEDMCAEAGVRVTLHSPVVAAYRDASRRNIDVIVTESKSGRKAWRAKTFIDCSGDGDLGALAGCGFDIGFGPEGWGQPATMNALAVVDDGDALAKCDFVSNDPAMWTPVTRPDGSVLCHHIAASRCISGDFYAHASYRVTGSSVALGEGVGRAVSM